MFALSIDSNRKCEVAIAIWALWFSRNKYVHENKMQHAKENVTFIRGFGLGYQDSALNLKHSKPRAMVKWIPLPQGWVKIKVDAGISVAKNCVVLCFIIRNEEGLIMGSGFKSHHLTGSVVIAETMVVFHGLQFALDLGFTRVILESDSRLGVHNIQQTNEDYSESRHFTWDVKNFAKSFHSCYFQFTVRKGIERHTKWRVVACELRRICYGLKMRLRKWWK
ncbi:hypothetical protein J1N35_025053 [Gossypium stocksii]|uniref:RNase H type-1 domain-containing protein n=1 Tax=Gossypium stocksii TaxID=47602 RepID=A0A9D3V691_9ROSI|nr:hypothetical protein J1N35_025053 [Gossypium stocksii]